MIIFQLRIYVLLMCLWSAPWAWATRDAETEHAFRTLAEPFVQIMGLSDRNIQYRLIISPAFNAMVAGGDNVFFNSGLILDVDSAEQFMAVLAHELAHIKSDDLQKVGKAQENAKKVALLGVVGGLVGSIASNDTDATIATISLGTQLADRSFKRHVRIQEKAADAVAFRAFSDLQMSLRGHIEVQKKLLSQGGYVTKQQSYTSTHPTSLERLRVAERLNENSQFKDMPADAQKQALFERIQAKLFGYVKETKVVLTKYPSTDTSDVARYARAMNAFANNKNQDGIAEMQVLIQKYPDDIYYLDSYATLLAQDTQYKQAVKIYDKILKKNRKTALFYIEYARALIKIGNTESLDLAEWALYRAHNLEKFAPYVYKNMIDLYRAKQDKGRLRLAEAEYAFVLGRPDSVALAKQAKTILSKNSPEYIRADDIVQTGATEKGK